METERITSVVGEILELEPELKPHEAELLNFVAQMEELNPRPVIDDRFVTSLRRDILSAPVRIQSPYMRMGWWAVRLAPIGALAVLLLILAPQAPYEPDQFEAPASSDPRVLDIEQGDADSSIRSVPMNGFGGGGGAADMGVQESTMSQKSASFAPAPVAVPFTILPQEAGVKVVVETITLAAPAFIVVSELTPYGEEVRGVSPLINPGTSENVPVYLRTKTVAGGSYSAALYRDNGDRVYTAEKDPRMFDEFGNPLQTFFEVME